jgi:hypothetical protein
LFVGSTFEKNRGLGDEGVNGRKKFVEEDVGRGNLTWKTVARRRDEVSDIKVAFKAPRRDTAHIN